MGSYYKMRYSTEPRLRKYGFLLFAKNVGNKYGKKLMDTATKTGIVKKTAEATGDLIVNKIADTITSISKPKKQETKKTEEIYIPPEKIQHIIDELRLF